VPYKVVLLPGARRQISSWGLPDEVLVEVYLRLRERLSEQPALQLRRQRQPFDGMIYRFRVPDPANRLCEHFFAFHVIYGQDEETLFVPRGGYVRSFGI
jgi:hypothetical protein